MPFSKILIMGLVHSPTKLISLQGIYCVVNPPAPIDCLRIYYQTQTNGFKSGIYLGFLQIQ